ncbi:type VI secretion system baseplate subunit TssE [Tropicibacter alexandrii]|uniref:type VI secretion system baseplate subunit TssE n=1 Tax=Tropicibacter alexandrii TaxID=2267683 RepID=UPI000EF52671|nr:type VI secretion system baseplate subunit TssE [Tropicibacter alexandrii]
MTDNETTQTVRRVWRKEDRAKVSMMQIFRSNYVERRRAQSARIESDETRRVQVREGVTETQLRAHIENDLNALLNTIRLDSIVSLKDHPHVARSILNYGFQDLSNVTIRDLGKPDVAESIRFSLICHEPRLVPETIRVRVLTEERSGDQRMELFVEAELMGDPVDVPLDFEAEVDIGAGKLRMSKLRVQV